MKVAMVAIMVVKITMKMKMTSGVIIMMTRKEEKKIGMMKNA